MKDRRSAIRANIARQEVVTAQKGNLALAPKSDRGAVSPEDDRPAIIEAFVTGLTGCLAEMKAKDRSRVQLWRSLRGLRETAKEYEITASEIVSELARRAGINVDLVVLGHEVVLDQPVGKTEENTTDVVAKMFGALPTMPPFHDFSRDDPWQYGVADDDRGIGRISGWFPKPGDETFGLHIVTKPSQAGMVSGDSSVARDEAGRFVSTTTA